MYTTSDYVKAGVNLITWKTLTVVVSDLHLAELAKTFVAVSPTCWGHWSMSTFWRSMSMPLVPLPKEVKMMSLIPSFIMLVLKFASHPLATNVVLFHTWSSSACSCSQRRVPCTSSSRCAHLCSRSKVWTSDRHCRLCQYCRLWSVHDDLHCSSDTWTHLLYTHPCRVKHLPFTYTRFHLQLIWFFLLSSLSLSLLSTTEGFQQFIYR